MNSVQAGRLRKTKLYVQDRAEFNRQLVADLETVSKRQGRTGIKQAIRLNGTSDILWEIHRIERDGVTFTGVPQAFPELQFYDYTKIPARHIRPANYHLTFSRSEVNDVVSKRMLSQGMNIAIVFHGTQLPTHWWGRKVIDGTVHDMRFLDEQMLLDEQERVSGDPPNVIVGLLTKGRARQDDTGFAVTINEENVA